ncbi:MAG: NADH-quinone oxidoreductase subunit D [Alphaproteobacteria bacterium ADurb.Bin438]|nr:MAG: NADH-quinone oxidoreductase subunit D [Alphaproteobacteria bacterium ADurb.Bin438]
MIINDYKIDYPPYFFPNQEPLRILIDQSGEKIVSVDYIYGFTHKALQKHMEKSSYLANIFYFKSIDNNNEISNTHAYLTLLEDALNIDVPYKTKFLRVIILELARIKNHLKSLNEIASLLDVKEIRNTSYLMINKINSLIDCNDEDTMSIAFIHRRFKDNFVPYLNSFLKDELNDAINHILKIFNKNALFQKRLRGLGVISKQDAIAFGISGVNLRASGISYDTRKNNPYEVYDKLNFELKTLNDGDCFSRYKLRLQEIFQSVDIINDALNKMPLGDYIYKDEKIVKIVDCEEKFTDEVIVKKGFYKKSTETPKGEFTINLCANDTNKPCNIKITAPSSNALFCFDKLCLNHFISDIPIILNSLDLSFGEIDK